MDSDCADVNAKLVPNDLSGSNWVASLVANLTHRVGKYGFCLRPGIAAVFFGCLSSPVFFASPSEVGAHCSSGDAAAVVVVQAVEVINAASL